MMQIDALDKLKLGQAEGDCWRVIKAPFLAGHRCGGRR